MKPNLSQMAEYRNELSDFCQSERIDGIDEFVQKCFFNYRIANCQSYSGNKDLGLFYDSMYYALEKATVLVQNFLIVREAAREWDDWQYRR